jgi:uncharacterized protein (TIGR02996 family)
MTPAQAFLADIRDNFDDDTPRLIYADWLEDHDDAERAALIRAQCELARLREDDPRCPALRQQASALLQANKTVWLGRLRKRLEKYTFRRGFIDTVRVEPKNLLEIGRELGRRAPLCQVILAGEYTDPLFLKLLMSPVLGWLSRLKLAGLAVPRRSFQWQLSAGELLSELTDDLGSLGQQVELRIGPAAAAALADPRCRLDLRQLDLLGRLIGMVGAVALANAPHLRSLTDLGIAANDILDAGALAVATSPHLRGLTRLDLTANHLSPDGIRAVLQAPNAQRLRYLGLGANGLGPAGAAMLARLEPLPNLTHLDLWHNNLGDEGPACSPPRPLFPG